MGFDAALEWTLLDGFREWLVVKAGFGGNLTWSALMLKMTPEGISELASLKSGPIVEDPHMAALFGALTSFLGLREEVV
jgi:hypothetical protein